MRRSSAALAALIGLATTTSACAPAPATRAPGAQTAAIDRDPAVDSNAAARPTETVPECHCRTMDDGAVVCAASLVEVDAFPSWKYVYDGRPLSARDFPPAFTAVIDGRRTSYR